MKQLNEGFQMNRLKSSIRKFTVTAMTWLTVTVFRYHNLVLSSFITYHQVGINSNTAGATSRAALYRSLEGFVLLND